MIYDDTSEVVEIPPNEWVKLAELNTTNQDVIRQRRIRELLRSMNNQSITYDETFFEKTEKQKFDIEKIMVANEEEKEIIVKMNNEEENSSLVTGILKVTTISSETDFAHGFKVTLENVVNSVTKEKQEDIPFDITEIYLNKRNFKNSNLNIILSMNQNTDQQYDSIVTRKKEYRNDLNLKRCYEEKTLSTLFYTFIYNNQNVSLMEIFKYFPRYENKKVTKHINN